MRLAPRPRPARRSRSPAAARAPARSRRRAGAAAAAPSPPAAGRRPAPTGPRERPLSLAIGYLRRDTLRKQAFERWRRAELGEGQALAHRRRRAAARAARAPHQPRRARPAARRSTRGRAPTPARLPGVRGAELRAVVALRRRARREPAADRRALRPRLPHAAPQRRVLAHARRCPRPASARRSARDPAVFQYYPGRGMQLQQLASWGRVNARLGVCIEPRKRTQRDLVAAIGGGRKRPLRAPALRRALDRLVALGARRDRFVAWEYYFSFGGGTPPWISGMTQGTAIQALARGSRVFRAAPRRYRRAAVRALGAFRAPPPVGVRVAAPGGSHYLMYSFSPGLRILNGDLQAITGPARPRRCSAAAAPRACSSAAASAPRARAVGRLRHRRLVAVLAGRARVDARTTTSSSAASSATSAARTRRAHLLLGAPPLRPLRARAAADPPRAARPPARRARHRAALLALQARLRARARHRRARA